MNVSPVLVDTDVISFPATALRLGVPLVTNNVSDFQPVDNLTVITASR